ncbi:hypothetical protein G6F54_004749 [Rhizopus delemar]|nr:hypothetical protein G6F54_004749 [Rhizopus delemar]
MTVTRVEGKRSRPHNWTVEYLSQVGRDILGDDNNLYAEDTFMIPGANRVKKQEGVGHGLASKHRISKPIKANKSAKTFFRSHHGKNGSHNSKDCYSLKNRAEKSMEKKTIVTSATNHGFKGHACKKDEPRRVLAVSKVEKQEDNQIDKATAEVEAIMEDLSYDYYIYKKRNNKRVFLSISQKIELLDQNATGQLNQTELDEWAMKKFNLDQPLAQQTISNILKNAETLHSNINVVNNGKNLKTTRYPQLDDEVVKLVADMNNNNLPVNRDSILRYRIGVKYRPIHGENALVDITSENIQNELRNIEEILEPYDPIDIMNFETGLYYQQPPRRAICSESLDGIKKKLNVAFGRQNRKIALLLDNASVHKQTRLASYRLLMQFSHSYFAYTGIIDNFKAHFRAQQYDRALCLYISKKLDNLNVYKIDQVQAMLFLANAWLKVKPETINGMLPDLLGNFDNKVTDVSQLNLEADESEMIVCYTTSTTNNGETAEGNIDETEENDNTEQDEQRVDIIECKKRLREAYETILMYEVPLDDPDRKLHRRIRMKLADSCAELNKSKEPTDLRSYFTNGVAAFMLGLSTYSRDD